MQKNQIFGSSARFFQNKVQISSILSINTNFESQNSRNQNCKKSVQNGLAIENELSSSLLISDKNKIYDEEDSLFVVILPQEKSLKEKQNFIKKILRSNSYKNKIRSHSKVEGKKKQKGIEKKDKKDKETKLYKIDKKIQGKQKNTHKCEEFEKKSQKIEIQHIIRFDGHADIKFLTFDRRQLQKKRQQLLRRNVDDWNYLINKRSQKRDLRNLDY